MGLLHKSMIAVNSAAVYNVAMLVDLSSGIVCLKLL
jgi:hypothetical protein